MGKWVTPEGHGEGEPATWKYAMPQWNQARPMIRQTGTFEGDVPDRAAALKLAVECANEAAGSSSTGAGTMWATVSLAWAAIAAAVPDASSLDLTEPVRSDVLLAVYGVEPSRSGWHIERCGHRHWVLLHDGKWLHPHSVTVCDLPPRDA